jgi:DNA-binding NtrC family response regulator
MSGSPKTRAHQVLLVDADFRSGQRLAELLAEDGFEVDTARDGASAIARLSRGPAPATLITELTVALADGAAIARYGRSLDPSLRVIVLTRHPNLVVPAAFGSPAPTVLTKPLDYPKLLELLEESAKMDSKAPGAGVASPIV